MNDSGNNGKRRFFGTQSVDFADDADIEKFALQVWREVARREGERAKTVGQDSPAAAQGEEQA